MLLIPALLAAIKSLSLSPIAIDLSNEKLYLLIAFLYNPGLGFLHSHKYRFVWGQYRAILTGKNFFIKLVLWSKNFLLINPLETSGWLEIITKLYLFE